MAGGPPIAPILYIDGKEADALGGMSFGGGEEYDSFVVPLFANHGDWTLKVLTDPVMTNNYQSYTDSVTFDVAVP